MTLAQGQVLNGHYRVVKLLGQGGYGAVYKAWDTTLTRPCAIKESFELSPEGQRQFLREAQILANLTHPNLPRVTDFFSLPGQGQYLVMDYVEGQDLEELRLQAGGPLPEDQVLGWALQVLDALEYLHRHKPPVIHRDIKPGNIKITPDNRAVLVDFGIAKAYEPQTKTTVGARAVTPGYSPFEQYGTGVTDGRTDIYAMGATLYALLTGEEPPEAPQRIVRDPLVPPGLLNEDLSAPVGEALLRALQVDPEARFQSAREFREALSSPSQVLGNLPPWMGTVPSARPASQPVAQPPVLRSGGGVASHPPTYTPTAVLPTVQAAIPVHPVPMITSGASTRRGACVGWGIVLLVVFGGVYIWYKNWYSEQQIVHARQTQVVQTVSARETQNAIVRATQTAQTAIQRVVDYQSASYYLLGPLSGAMEHVENLYVESVFITSSQRDFLLDVTFTNPYAASFSDWDIGVMFRHVGTNEQFRLSITSEGQWAFYNHTGDGAGEMISRGELSNLSTGDGETNRVTLMAQGNEGILFLNNAFISDLDLSARPYAGDIYIATGLYDGDEWAGEATGYYDLYLWGTRE